MANLSELGTAIEHRNNQKHYFYPMNKNTKKDPKSELLKFLKNGRQDLYKTKIEQEVPKNSSGKFMTIQNYPVNFDQPQQESQFTDEIGVQVNETPLESDD